MLFGLKIDMKRILSLILSLIFICLTSCSSKTSTLAQYETEGQKPSFVSKLYTDPRKEEYAFLIREPGQMQSSVAIGKIGGEMTTVYTASPDCCIYSLYTNAGIVAFYELYPQTDGSVRYDLKVIDTESGETYTPYSKLLSEDNDMQSGYLTVYNDCVYYLTVSLRLQSCRIMKFDLSDSSLTEFVTLPFTENELTYNHSCTFFNRKGDNMILSRVEGSTQYIDVYSISSGEKKISKELPDTVGIVYNCDYDSRSGTYALYYAQIENGEFGADAVGLMFDESDEIKRIFQSNTDTYLDRDALCIQNNILIFNLSRNSDTVQYDNYDGVLYNMATDELTRFPGSIYTWYDDDAIYNLSLDKKVNGGKMTIDRRQIVAE